MIPRPVVKLLAVTWAAMALCWVPVIFIGQTWNARAYAWLAVLLAIAVTGLGALTRAIWLMIREGRQAS